jgi:hypothetical protein
MKKIKKNGIVEEGIVKIRKDKDVFS